MQKLSISNIYSLEIARLLSENEIDKLSFLHKFKIRQEQIMPILIMLRED